KLIHALYPDGTIETEQLFRSGKRLKCPYGQVGDRLWVREKFAIRNDGRQVMHYAGYQEIIKALDLPDFNIRWKPSIHMPRWASRILLENTTDPFPQRLQEITEEDARAEGANPFLLDKLTGGTKYRMLKTYHHEVFPLVDHADEGEIIIFECPNMGFARLHHTQWKEKQDPVFRIPAREAFEYVGAVEPDYRNGFRILWDSLNAKRGYGWETNPWVWVITFRKIK
ncbi:unnamed protein product, partial [marine sediment metagenome]